MKFNRAKIVDQNFAAAVTRGRFPSSRLSAEPGHQPDDDVLAALFESQIISRHFDLKAREMKDKNACFYTIGSSGHEGNAVFGRLLRPNDMAFLHYRSAAFFLERARQIPGTTPFYDLALSFVSSSEDPITGGRHKVFGSAEMSMPPQTSTIASHLPKAVGAAISIDRAAALNLEDRILPDDGIIVCSFGDASLNQAAALSAINTALWASHHGIPVPIIFICEDNGLGISVKTPSNWIESVYGRRTGLQYVECDGLHLIDLLEKTTVAEKAVRKRRKPLFLRMKTVRLLGHAGSDIQSTYHSLEKIEAAEANDPLLHSARIIRKRNIMSGEEMALLYESLRRQVGAVFEHASGRPKLSTAADVITTILPPKGAKTAMPMIQKEKRKRIFGNEFSRLGEPQHMAKLINYALTDILARYQGAVAFGEDVGRKGGVYHVTAGLQEKFGPRRVFDSMLDETSIIGTAIGMAHNGFLPIAEIQFLAYFHNAEDQLRGEAATLSFFSLGKFVNPVILRVPGLAYQKGFGGHFHNDNSLAVFRDIPGIIIACPSNGADAARMLWTVAREAHENGRISVFIEPIALYMTKDLHNQGDRGWSFAYPDPDKEIELGEFTIHGTGRNLTIVTYGNGAYLSRKAADVLEKKHRKKCRIIDLRWLAPLNEEGLVKSLGKCPNILIVEECRRTGSMGEALVGLFAQGCTHRPAIKLHAAEDCFIPLGEAATAILPTKETILAAALEMVT
ncbi:MAG: thiamine pyrophosphate-dependent enzyme [Candidatus Neomarinimicrobiota bacterium]|nr:thiamine pyrophosphate-dependent enzyme [Candidatus Neomarinimicrobiota bacterium]